MAPDILSLGLLAVKGTEAARPTLPRVDDRWVGGQAWTKNRTHNYPPGWRLPLRSGRIRCSDLGKIATTSGTHGHGGWRAETGSGPV